jgi:hypothetical protein
MANDERGVYRIILNYSLYQSYKNPENMGFFGVFYYLFSPFFLGLPFKTSLSKKYQKKMLYVSILELKIYFFLIKVYS